MTSTIDYKSGFVPQFDSSKALEIVDELPVKGTGMLIYQGLNLQQRTVRETGEIVNIPVFVFGVLSQDNNFKNIGVNINTKTLKLFFKALGLEVPKVTSDTRFAKAAKEIKGLKAFATTTTVDKRQALDMLSDYLGKVFTSVLERRVSNYGKPYYSILIDSLAPLFNGDEIYQGMEPDDCDPTATDFEGDIGQDELETEKS
ncbi:MAG: hypothetical protein AAF208_06685 [Cyanobacteria bacterium P01_A01_bin.45]